MASFAESPTHHHLAVTGVGEDLDRTMGVMDGGDPVGDGAMYPCKRALAFDFGVPWGRHWERSQLPRSSHEDTVGILKCL